MRISVIDNSAADGQPTEFVNGPADGEVMTVNRDLKKYIIAITVTPVVPDVGSKPLIVEHLYELDESGAIPVFKHKRIVKDESV